MPQSQSQESSAQSDRARAAANPGCRPHCGSEPFARLRITMWHAPSSGTPKL